MALSRTPARVPVYGRPADPDFRRPFPAGLIHFLIAGTVTAAALLLISSGWMQLRKAIGRGQPIQVSPPGPVIQLSHFPDPAAYVSPIAPLFTPQVQSWSEQISTWSAEYDLDPNLVATVMQIESCGHPEIVSGAGAAGLFQVMPYHFVSGEDPFSPQTNARRGLVYLHRSLQLAEGDVRLALAGYNGGHGVIMLPVDEWPDETIRYVYWGSGIYRDAEKNRSTSERLEEWLGAGGTSLCAQAELYSAGKE